MKEFGLKRNYFLIEPEHWLILDKLRGNFAGLTGGAGFDWVRPESVPPDRDLMVGAAKRWRNARGQRRRQLPQWRIAGAVSKRCHSARKIVPKWFITTRKRNKLIESRNKTHKIQKKFWDVQKLKHNLTKIKYTPA